MFFLQTFIMLTLLFLSIFVFVDLITSYLNDDGSLSGDFLRFLINKLSNNFHGITLTTLSKKEGSSVSKKDYPFIPNKYLKESIFQHHQTIEEWYVLYGDMYKPLAEVRLFADILQGFKYTGNKRDVAYFMKTFMTKGINLPLRYFEETHWCMSDYLHDYDDEVTLYNARIDKAYRVKVSLLFYFIIFINADYFKAEHETFIQSIEEKFENLTHTARSDYLDKQAEKTLDRLDFSGIENIKLGRMDASKITVGKLSDDFKEDCLKYNEAYDRLLKYDQLGKDIFSILENPLDKD